MKMQGVTVFFGIKLARLATLYVASAIAVRVQEAKYVEEVYGRGNKPPSLNGFLLILACFMVVFDAVLLAVVKALGEMGVKAFAKKQVLSFVLAESLVYTLFVLGVGFFLTRIVAHKRYINYRDDGLRALRALREMLMAIVVPISLTPTMFLS
jgi:hypothetical protein